MSVRKQKQCSGSKVMCRGFYHGRENERIREEVFGVCVQNEGGCRRVQTTVHRVLTL